MNRETFEKKKKFAGKKKPSMNRRKLGHDYSSRCVYLVTLKVDGERPLLATVERDAAGEAVASPTLLGRRVLEVWNRGPAVYPALRLFATCLMPDHLHAVLFITAAGLDLRRVINGFKACCREAYAESGYADDSWPRLWQPSFNDKPLLGKNALQSMIDYVRDNPRRLLLRRDRPELFVVRHDVPIGGRSVDAQGNLALLERPRRLQVKVSRRVGDKERAALVREYLRCARDGAVLVSPFVSPGEKAVREAAMAAELPLVIAEPNGYAARDKPAGDAFYACAAGRLLRFSPWEHSNERLPLTRKQCDELNDLCAALSTEGPL